MNNKSLAAGASVTRDLTVLASALAGVRPYPQVVEQVRSAARDPRSAAMDIARIVEGDVGTATDVLRVANAPASGLAQRCTSVRHAVSLLGLKRVTEVVAGAAALAFVEQSTTQHPALASHALAVAGVSRLLAPIVAMSADEAFTLGLLHDVGALLVVQSEDPFYEGLIDQAPPGEEPSVEDERALMGFDHGALGAEVLRQWNVPEPLPQVVALHHLWDEALAAGGAVTTMVAVLRVADVLVAVLEGTPEPRLDDLDPLFTEPAFAHLGLTREELFRMWPGLRRACSKAFVIAESDEDYAPRAAPALPPSTATMTPTYGVPGHVRLHAPSEASSKLGWWLGALLVLALGIVALVVKL